MANSLTESRRKIILNSPHIASASGSIVSVNDAIKAKLKSCVVDIKPVQEGTGDPSPDNIRPISGWTGAQVTRCGKNLCNPATIIIGSYVRAGNTSESRPLGEQTENSQWNCSDFISVKPLSQYTTNVPNYSSASAAGLVFFDSFKNAISGIPTVSQRDRIFTFTTPSNCSYLRFSWSRIGGTDVQLAVGTDSSYSPYTGTTYPITWQTEAGTVYGGTLNVKTGELTVTHGVLDLGDLSWVYTTLFYAYSPANSFALTSGDLTKKLMCSCYKVISGTAPSNPDKMITMNNSATGSSKVIRVYDTDYTDATAFKTAVTGQKLVYELATPVTYQLTPTQINTMLGTNNIWADTGDTSVKYWAHS